MHAIITEAQTCHHGIPGGCFHGVMDAPEGILPVDRVPAGTLDAQEASIGCKADFPQGGKMPKTTVDADIVGVVDGRLGAKSSPFLIVLLDTSGLIVDIR